MEDLRKSFIVSTIVDAIAPSDQRDGFMQYVGNDESGALAAFLDNVEVSTLQVSVFGLGTGKLQLKLSNTSKYPSNCQYQIVISKRQPGVLKPSDIPENVSVQTISNSPVSSLYHALRDIYSPILSDEVSDQDNGIDARLKELLKQVQAGLGSAVRRTTQQGETIQAHDPNLAPLHDISSPLDEIDFWAELASNPSLAGPMTRSAQQVHSHLECLRQPYSSLEVCKVEGDWEGVHETVEMTADAVKQAWTIRLPAGGWAFGQKRMENFFRAIGAAIARYVSTRLKDLDFWASDFSTLRGALIGGTGVVTKWVVESESIVEEWAVAGKAGNGHEWEGEKLVDNYTSAFQKRLEEIYVMRETHDELGRLLGTDEVDNAGGKEIFRSFANLQALQVSEFTEPVWQAAKGEYERRMAPLEQKIIVKLKELFATIILPNLQAANSRVRSERGGVKGAMEAQQVFQELKRYSGLVGRPAVSAALVAEKEALSKQIETFLGSLRAEFEEHRAAATKYADGDLTAVSDQIMWTLKCQLRATKTQEVVALMAGKESGKNGKSDIMKRCSGLASVLVKDLESFKKEQFAIWEDKTMVRLKDMAQWKGSKLLAFDSQDLHIKTHMHDTLGILVKEMRQMQSIGFAIKPDIMTEIHTANKFYKSGIVLKQRANFYNNIATEMIPCQKPMLMPEAAAFEQAMMNPKDVQNRDITWKNVTALEGYVRRVCELSDRLAERNRYLRKCHVMLSEKVITLMGTDLVRQRERWAAGVKEMREVFQRLEGEGFPAEDQQQWRQHWDYQLYKALEYQYLQGLECINKTLPEVEIKMVYRQHKLQYEPPLEELRIKHYKDFLNTFLGLPLRMKGVSDLSERPGFFRSIADSNPAGMAKVYFATEVLFGTMAEEVKKYQDWMVLGGTDMDDFVEENLSEIVDWELNFRILKSAARDAEKLPNDIKMDCYTVSMAPIKATIDEHIKRLQEALISSLRRKAALEKEIIEDYIKQGHSLFESEATTVDDIGKAGMEATKMVNGLDDIVEIRRRIEDKNKLLRQMATASGGAAQFAVVDTTEIGNAWESFTTQLMQFDKHLDAQRGQLGISLSKQVDEMGSRAVSFEARWKELKPLNVPAGNPAVMLSKISEFASSVEEIMAEAEKMTTDCELFRLEKPDFKALEALAADVAVAKKSWDRYGEFLKERNDLANKDWLFVRDQVWKIEDFLAKWLKPADKDKNANANDPIAIILSKEVDNYRLCLPFLKAALRGAGWEDEHWLQLFTMLGFKMTGPNPVSKETITLTHFLDKAEQIVKNGDKIKALDAQAQGESVIRKALTELKVWGLQREFTLTEGGAAGGKRKVPLIKEWRDIMTEVGDHQSLVASLKQSNYFHLFKDEITMWEGKLTFLQEGLTLLNQIQRRWVYLEPIFSRGALPAQQARFRGIDEDFKRIMTSVDADKHVVSFAEIPGIKDRLPTMAQQLDVCQRALADFLEDKRSQFPRFYFIGDDDLLEILGQSKNPAVIQSHLKKLFAGIHKVKFTEDKGGITTMCSMETEEVKLTKIVQVTDSIETWLGQLNNMMKATLNQQIDLVRNGSLPNEFAAAASQTLCLKDALSFTERCEAAIMGGHLPKLQMELVKQLTTLTTTDYTGQHLLQLKMQTLVLDFIHYIDVVNHLIEQKSGAKGDWAWSRQLRYYGRPDGRVVVAMSEATFDYTWEYQGNAAKLVYTPLTDKCYMTLTQGMALGYGGNPYGPAGTGKTESVKALGQALARQVLVFNCDEEFDFKSMGRIFTGLVKCGAWGCFDEFNRLDEEVLSAVSQQIQIIQGALKEGAVTMQFMDKSIQVDKNAGIFVTLNPAGKGYGGRSKLPDNLKQLFRSIAMTVPDNELIAEVLLVSEGFSGAKEFARKLVGLFSLSRELLSPQQHYDWGLRALKTCLGVAGRELREERKTKSSLTAQMEIEIIIRAICAIKLPTLTFDDNARFRALLGDLFPGAAITDARNAELEKAIAEVAVDMALDLTQQQIEKMLQLHLACMQRIGVIIVGPSGSGKSTLWEVLEKAYEKLHRRPIVYKMNPKAMHRQQLLGSMNMDTREWSDGVLTAAARKVVKEALEQRSWIVCDGDVDPEWIESLNSVLDDNRLLTMPNGERIQFANNINFIFECHSLEFASPATVSRCGMLFMSDENTDVERMVKKWIKIKCNGEQATKMQQWFKEVFSKTYGWALSHEKAVDTTKVGTLHSGLSHLEPLPTSKREFVCGLTQGLAANMPETVRATFLTDMTKLFSEADLLGMNQEDPLRLLGKELRERTQADEDAETLVMTDQMRLNLNLIAPWLKNKEPIILVGPEGCGKSTLLEYCFRRIMGLQVAMVHCSAQTSAANVIQKLVQVCGKPVTTTSGKALRPPDNTRVILYLKDINLPRPDKYNTMQLISFLQQLIAHKGYYDDNLDFIIVERVQIVGSMNPASTVGRHALSTRFTALARILSMSYPPKEQLQAVYTSMVDKTLANMHLASGQSAASIAAAMIDVYTQVQEGFSATEHAHYQFNPRDVTRWVQGLEQYNLDNMELVEAVAAEGARIFSDRLVGAAGRDKFNALLLAVVQKSLSFKGDVSRIICSTLGSSAEDRMSGDLSRVKLLKWGHEEFAELVGGKLIGYEREFKELHIMLFPEVLQLVTRFDRVMAQLGGSLLLCGHSGVGRRSTMLLLAYMHHLEFMTPKMTKNYDMKAFRNELKEVLRKAGVEGKPVLYYIEDHQLGEGGALELLNSLLAGGEVPGLFTNEELAKELGGLDSARHNDNLYTGPATTYDYFIYRIRRNLHMTISMDPANELFRSRCESNPALFTRCSVQWMDGWSSAGLRYLTGVKLKPILALSKIGKGKDDEKDVISLMMSIHETRKADATQRHYIAFVDLYSKIFSTKRSQVLDQQKFLKGGLHKLAEAEVTVDKMSKEADVQRAALKIKAAEAEDALTRIQASMEQAAGRRKEVEVLRKKLAVEEKDMKARSGGVEQELAAVQPQLDEARKAVGQIKSDNINEIRSLKMPPEAIRDVLEGVLMVLGQDDTSWNNMKKFLGSRAVKEDIINYDARKITPQTRTKVGKLLASKGNSFEHAVIYRVSVAAAPLAAWVKANIAYSMVLERVEPLERELTTLRTSLETSTKLIKQYEEELVELDTSVKQLKADFGKKTGEAETLRISVEKAEGILVAARSLLEKLSGEKTRWVAQVKTMDQDLATLPLNALLTSAFCTYLPGYPEDMRAKIMAGWCKSIGVKTFDVCRFMSSESEMLVWKIEGLPADDLSMQNSIVILNSTRSPLIIDPASQAANWLQTHLRNGTGPPLEVVSMHDPRFTNSLELAVRFGKTLVIQEVDRVDGILYPLLRADLERQGPRFVVQVGDKLIDYNDTFRLYLVTRNPTPYLPPDAKALIAPTNFTVTRSGMEGQLLGLTIQKEQPELEAQKSTLLRQEEELKVQLAALEKSLLHNLATSTGNLLENKELLDSLNETKSKSTTITSSLAESKQLQVSLDSQRNVYRPIAARGSTLYFLVMDLASLNHMYRLSLATFLELFKKALEETQAGDVKSRISALSAKLLELVFAYVSRSLFNSDRLTFAMHMAHGLRPDLFKDDEWNFFLGKAVGSSAGGTPPAPPSWITEEITPAYNTLASALPNLVTSAELTDSKQWSSWISSPDIMLPQKVAPSVTHFQSLLLIKALRPDKLQSSMTAFALKALNIKSVAPPQFSFKDLTGGGYGTSAILFITTPGADPSQELAEMAGNTVGRDRYHEVAMGQGQAEVAMNLLREAARDGGWLLLKNLHLAVSWLPTLEKELFTIDKHQDFCLFLTSEPHNKFPSTLLEMSLKVTYEAPPGLKKNLQRTYDAWSPAMLAKGPAIQAQLLFVLAWFHAVVQERRNYIPQGWSKFYEFSFADLRGGTDLISIITRDGKIQWAQLHGLLENAIYGGRVDNTFDAKVLRTYLRQYFNADVLGLSGSKRALPGSSVVVPTGTSKDDYVNIISALPDIDAPALFSLPANIDRTAQQSNSLRVIEGLKTMTLVTAAAAGFNRQAWSSALAPLLRHWDKLVAANAGLKAAVRDAAKAGAGKGEAKSPVDTFVAMERAHGHMLLGLLDRSLASLARVLKGTELLSPAVQALGSALLADTIPGTWDAVWEGPETPSDYCRAVVSRVAAIEQWWSKSVGGNLLTGGALDLAQIFHPGTFLNALRQQTSRALKLPMDALKLATCWDASRLANGSGPFVQVGGLLMQGAIFEGSRLGPLSQDAPTSRAVPPMGLAWIAKDSPYPYAQHMAAPLYFSGDRSKVLAEVQLPVSNEEEGMQWLLTGTALFLGS